MEQLTKTAPARKKIIMKNANLGYQGWDNYETWAVNLWIGNDHGSSEYWNGAASDLLDESEADLDLDYTKEMVAAAKLADMLKDHHEQALPELQGFAADLLNAAIGEVNWLEIAIHLVEQVSETATA